MTTRSFINPKSNYDPNNFNNIYPKDWGYRVPKAYSNLGYEKDDEDDEDDDEKEKDKKGEKPEVEENGTHPEENPENPEP